MNKKKMNNFINKRINNNMLSNPIEKQGTESQNPPPSGELEGASL